MLTSQTAAAGAPRPHSRRAHALAAPSAKVAVVAREHAARRIPAVAWPSLLAAGTLLAFATGRGGMLQLAFPAAAVLVGLVLYRESSPGYLAYAWGLWLVAPWVRRVVDYQAGWWNPQSVVNLTPLLVSAIAAAGVAARPRALRRRSVFPFALAFVGIAYGYAIGMVRNGPMAATYALAAWGVPMTLGAYVAARRELYVQHRDALLGVTCWGLLLLGIYGVVQFIRPGPWDQFWMLNSGMQSIGQPEPFQVRVFSMSNSPGPLATFVAAGLLLLGATRGSLRITAIAAGSAALLLSLVRSAWIGCALGCALYLCSRPGRALWRTTLMLACTTGVLVLLAGELEIGPIQPLVEPIASRAETLRDVAGDESYVTRLHALGAYLDQVVVNPVGAGLGSTGTAVALVGGSSGVRDFDNGLLEVPYVLGWLGALAFGSAIVWLLVATRSSGRGAPGGRITSAVRAALLCTLVQVLSGNVFTGPEGAVTWVLFGLAAAGCDGGQRAMRPAMRPAMRRAMRRAMPSVWSRRYGAPFAVGPSATACGASGST